MDNKEFIKPECALIGEDGNIFNLMGKASRALKRAGYREQAAEMQERVTSSGNYHEALGIIMEYVDEPYDEPDEDIDMDM